MEAGLPLCLQITPRGDVNICPLSKSVTKSFSEDVPANNTIWILGDSLLTNASSHYNQFKKKNLPRDGTLYMENLYAIRIVSSGIYTAEQAKNIPSILLNSIVDTLNVKAKVPHSIVILINDQRFWNNGDLLTYHQMERIINRFFKEIRRIIEDRNLSLPPRAVNWDYPRIFISKALPLPNNMTKPYPKGFKANRRKYNKLIQRGEIQHNYRSINFAEFTGENANALFSNDGSISTQGYTYLWSAISDAIHKADNFDRIMINKAKAKQLAAEISVTLSEISNMKKCTDVSDISDIEELKGETCDIQHKSVKRSLCPDFERSSLQAQRQVVSQMSPASNVSEYFTAANKNNINRHDIPWQCGNPPYFHPKSTRPGQGFHHKPNFRKKRRINHNWRNNGWRQNNNNNY